MVTTVAVALAAAASPLTVQVGVTAAVVLLASVVQRLTGFGFALLATPLLAFAMPVVQAVVLIALVALPSGAMNAWDLRASVSWPHVRRMVLWSVPGMAAGIAVHRAVSESALRLALAASVLGAVVLLASGARLTTRGPGAVVAESAAGFVSGVLNTTTGTNGPPLVLVLAGQDLAPDPFRATLSTVFAASGVVAIALFAVDGSITRRAVELGALGLPLVFIGRHVGARVAARISPARFRLLVLWLLVATALSSAVRVVL